METLNICKLHCTKTSKDNLHANPTKLTRHELEDFYYILTQDNEELKKTVNSQNDKLRILSAKLARRNAPKQHLCQAPAKCCTAAHMVIEEQICMIQDLEKTVDRLNARINQLNMRLCTQKQFLKTTPYDMTHRKSHTLSAASRKPIETSRSNSGRRLVSKHSHRDLESNDSDVRTVITNEVDPEPVHCDHTKYEDDISELIKTVERLQEELAAACSAAITQEERIQTLERNDTESRQAVHEAEKRAKEQRTLHTQQLTRQLREAQAKAEYVAAELVIEKKKVIELNTHLKSVTNSRDVVSMLEEHFLQTISSTGTQKRTSIPKRPAVAKCVDTNDIIGNSTLIPHTASNPGPQNVSPINETIGANQVITQLTKKIVEIQSQLDALSISKVSQSDKTWNCEDRNNTLLTCSPNHKVTKSVSLKCRDNSTETENFYRKETCTQTSTGDQSPSPVERHSVSNKTYTVEEEREEMGNKDTYKSPPSSKTERDVASVTTDTSEKEGENMVRDDKSRTDGIEEYSTTEYSSYSDSADTTTNIYSDGELPSHLYCGRRASNVTSKELRSSDKAQSPMKVALKVQEALKVISTDLTRCQTLLRPRDLIKQN